jgi:hypothetical protein
MMMTRMTRCKLAALLSALAILASCIGAGDMFAEKRKVVGNYFLMTDEGDQHSYYLFRKGQTGSITGPLRAIGWDQHFILVQEEGIPGGWAAFSIHPQNDRVVNAAAQGDVLIPRLRRIIKLRSPSEVWDHSPQLGSWFSRPFS